MPFTGSGFPDFSRYSKANVRVKLTPGKPKLDFKAANKAAGFTETPDNFTWHHHQDVGRLQLVPTRLHNTLVKHTGGVAVIKGKLK